MRRVIEWRKILHSICPRRRSIFACDSIDKNYSNYKDYNKNLDDVLEQGRYIISNIDRALEENWIQVYYQPIVRAVNGKVCNEEAFARWNDPERGALFPTNFIPHLEAAGLVFKLDLYILEQVLEKIRVMKEAGYYIVPQSINLSRSDFDTCDIVEEIRRRVDRTGVDRNIITIEITESAIGRDFEFMKSQIERFRELGFSIWMDDFGRSYSSFDVLQSVRFDLIKFDLSFMKRLDGGAAGRIVLTELMKMATSLGFDTVCEGVETEAQVRFLQAIGCSKLQGNYYLKPVPLETILDRYERGIQIGFENPKETEYFEAVGRINLYDFSFMTGADDNAFRNVFDMAPMGIMEVNVVGDGLRCIRSNQSFRVFMRRAFGVDVNDPDAQYPVPESGAGSEFMRMIEECRINGDRVFADGQIADGAIVHSFARRVYTNPVTGTLAVAVAVLSVEEPHDLSREYYELVQENIRLKKEADVIRKIAELKESVTSLLTNMPAMTFSKDMDTGRYLACNQSFAEYANKETPEDVVGLTDFDLFDRETAERFVEDDRKAAGMDKPYVFVLDVRDAAGKRRRVEMKKLKFIDTSGRSCLLGLCQDLTEEMLFRRKYDVAREAYESARDTNIVYARLYALTGNFLCVYVVDPQTESYYEFNSNDTYRENFAQAEDGTDFFGTVQEFARIYNYHEDLERFLLAFTKENVMKEIEHSGFFSLGYRLVMLGRPYHVQMKAAMVEEKEGQRLIVGINDVDAQVRQEEEYEKRLVRAQSQANIDALTGIKNKNAYLEAEKRLNGLILRNRQPIFAITLLDVNDLKKVNDTAGHQAGDDYIRNASRIICKTFKHSPVFRVGGDEFAVISQGRDYEHIDELVELMGRHNEEALSTDGIVIACGMARYADGESVEEVFALADRNMYENKRGLKGI